MSNHHHINVKISGTNAAAAANAVKAYFADGKPEDGFDGSMVKGGTMLLAADCADEPNEIVFLEPYSGVNTITLIAGLSTQFPTEQFDLTVNAGNYNGSFQGTLTIQDGKFFDVDDEEDDEKVEWEDLIIRKVKDSTFQLEAAFVFVCLGRLGKGSKKVSIGGKNVGSKA